MTQKDFFDSIGHNRTHAPLVWARVESVYFDFAGLSPGLIVLPLSSRVIGREISRSSFKLSDCALGESRIAVQIVGIQGLDHDPRSILSLCWRCVPALRAACGRRRIFYL
jgi:hypothetical protein